MEIDDKVYRLITRRGFVSEFWSELHACETPGAVCTRRAVYERLESIYENEFGERKFTSYSAFRQFISRKSRKG